MNIFIKNFEFELAVYVKARTRENMEDFLAEQCKNQKIFLKEPSSVDSLFSELMRELPWKNKESASFVVSDFWRIFNSKKLKRSKGGSLSKSSFLEFMKRQSENSSKKNTDCTYLSNDIKRTKTINLSQRKFKIIDYGNCYDYSDERYGLINTRQYRAPEVILSGLTRLQGVVRENRRLVAGLSPLRTLQGGALLPDARELPPPGADRKKVA